MASRVALPISEETLMLFASYLAQQGLAHTTIKVYLFTVCNLHVSFGLHQEFTQQLTPRLEMVLQRIKKNYLRTAQNRVHLPITQNVTGPDKTGLIALFCISRNTDFNIECTVLLWWLDTVTPDILYN